MLNKIPKMGSFDPIIWRFLKIYVNNIDSLELIGDKQ